MAALLRSLSLDEKTGGSTLLPEQEQPEDHPDPNEHNERPSKAAGEQTAADDLVAAGEQPAEEEQPVEEEEEEEQGAYLPDECVKLIQHHLVQGEALGVALLHLLSMAGVCRQWRALASEAHGALALDCFDSAYPTQPSVAKWRRLSAEKKELVLLGAGKLFAGYSDVLMSGEGVSDRVLEAVAARNGERLARAKVQASANVTDAGLTALVAQAKNLQMLEVQGLTKPCAGKFLPLALDACSQLQELRLSNIPGLQWGPCKAACGALAAATGGAPAPLPRLTQLTARGVNLDGEFGVVLARLPELQELEVDGSARIIRDACLFCPKLVRVSYTVSSRASLDEALNALMALPRLRQLELVVKNFTLCSEQLRVIGMLPLVELRLDSFIHKQQPTLSRSSYSHVDNEGVKALVDSICNRWCSMGPGDMQPLKLSLCGASALTHDAVSALLRLPILTELDIGGCARIIAMDKMRLVAKVRAGREMLDSGRRPTARTSRFPGLLI